MCHEGCAARAGPGHLCGHGVSIGRRRLLILVEGGGQAWVSGPKVVDLGGGSG
jgi:hypothetical protein